MKPTRRLITGEYNRHGYTVLLCQRGRVSTVYSAGNHPQDSQERAFIGVGLRELRRYCIRCCREIAIERQAAYGGVTRIPED